MAPPSATQELVPTVINDAVLKTILRQIRKLQQYQKRHLESSCQEGIFTVRYIDDQIHLLNELFLQICSSLSSCVEGLSFNCNPVTVNATTSVSVDIEGTRRAVVVEPAEPKGKPSYLSVAKRNLKEVSSPDTPIRISVSTSTAHDLANTIINDLVFKLIMRALKDLEKEATIPRLKYVDLLNLLARLVTIICCVLVKRVEGVSLIGCPGYVGDSTAVVFNEGCYVREIRNP